MVRAAPDDVSSPVRHQVHLHCGSVLAHASRASCRAELQEVLLRLDAGTGEVEAVPVAGSASSPSC